MESSSRTLVETEHELVIRLEAERRRVQFTDDTVDNEGMNKKKSNICCIFRKKDCSSDESEEDDHKNDYERQPKYKN
jgi:protein phosphatase 1 regulatory subunit 11